MDTTDSSTNSGQAGTAKERVGEVASTSVESGKWVAAVGQDEAKNVVSTATQQAGQLAGEASAQARNLLDESKVQLRSQAQTQTDQIAAKLRELGDQVQALVEGRTQEAGPVGDYARQAAQSVTQFAGRVEERGFDGVIDDVQRFARRKPGTFLLGAAIAGFGVGRLLRAGGMSQQTTPQVPATPQTSLYGQTQPPLVDVSDGAVAGMTTREDTYGTTPGEGFDPSHQTAAGEAAVSPISAPTDPGRIR